MSLMLIAATVVAAEIITYAILTRVSLTWISRWTHAGPWEREGVRQGILTAERHITRVANLGEWVVRPAHFLEIRVQRHDAKSPVYALAGLFGVVVGLITLLGGGSAGAVLLGVTLASVAVLGAVMLQVRFTKAGSGTKDEENTGLVFDLRPVAAVFLIGIAVWFLRGLA
jgi:hypothetical protein